MRDIDRDLTEVYRIAALLKVDALLRDRKRGFNGYIVNPLIEREIQKMKEVKEKSGNTTKTTYRNVHRTKSKTQRGLQRKRNA